MGANILKWEKVILLNFWWLVELLYWFKARFFASNLGMYTTRGEIDNFM